MSTNRNVRREQRRVLFGIGQRDGSPFHLKARYGYGGITSVELSGSPWMQAAWMNGWQSCGHPERLEAEARRLNAAPLGSESAGKE